MEEILDLLLKVQALDDEIKDAQIKIGQIPNQIAALEKEKNESSINLSEKKSRLNEVRKMYKTKEGDLADNETKIKKLNAQTFSVKTNEEYRAIINEIDFLKKENKKIEDEMINLLEEEDGLKGLIGHLEKETTEFMNVKNAAIEVLKKEQESLSEKRKRAELNFQEDFQKLPEEVRTIYQNTNRVRGRAVCLISDNTCTGCFANLTHQFLNELKKRNKILLCDNCGRILIYGPRRDEKT